MTDRNRSSRVRSITVLATLLVLSALIAGCYSQASDEEVVSWTGSYEDGLDPGSTMQRAPLPSPDQPTHDVAGAEYGLATEDAAKVEAAPTDSMVIKTANARLRVEDIDEAVSDIRSATSGVDGTITDMQVSSDEPVRPLPGSETQVPARFAFVTVRVPAERLDAFLESVREIGAVLDLSESSSDVTEQYVDLTARLANLQAQEARLREFFDRAESVEDLLAIERELTRVRGDIEGMQAQVDYLERQSAMSTVSIQLETDQPLVDPQGPFSGLRSAVANGISGAIALVEGLIVITIGALPLVVLIIVLALIVRAFVMRARRKRVDSVEDDQADV